MTIVHGLKAAATVERRSEIHADPVRADGDSRGPVSSYGSWLISSLLGFMNDRG